MKGKINKYWWITSAHTEINTPFINYGTALKYKNFNKLKFVVWKMFRSKLDHPELSARDKIVFWCICERLKGSSFSCWDSYSYLGKMLCMNRKTIAKAVDNLSANGLIMIAVEGEKPTAMKTLPSQQRVKKHILIIGLGHFMGRELES